MPMMLLRLDNKRLWIEHHSANGFQYVGGSDECAEGAADKDLK